MSDHRSLSLNDVADILKIGETTLNVWRKRYKKWMPMAVDGEGLLFSESILDVFRFISKCIHAGMEPQEVECALDSRIAVPLPETAGASQTTGSSDQTQVVLTTLVDTFSGLVGQQQRIAEAQERRAMAEERKAYAMESQAEAELIKANALRDMVSLFQNMTVKDSVNVLMDKVRNMVVPSPAELEDFTADVGYTPDQLDDFPELTESLESVDATEKTMDTDPVEDDIHEIVPEAPQDFHATDDVDDLSQLIDDAAVVATQEIVDDLSLLIEVEDDVSPKDMDDLSLLIDDEEEQLSSTSVVADNIMAVDDLSKLIEPDELPKVQAPVKEIKQPAKVDQDYKSKILKRIIQMKQQEKLSIEETTRRFNDEGVKTLSGKGKWDSKTIQGIYKYIDSVQGG